MAAARKQSAADAKAAKAALLAEAEREAEDMNDDLDDQLSSLEAVLTSGIGIQAFSISLLKTDYEAPAFDTGGLDKEEAAPQEQDFLPTEPHGLSGLIPRREGPLPNANFKQANRPTARPPTHTSSEKHNAPLSSRLQKRRTGRERERRACTARDNRRTRDPIHCRRPRRRHRVHVRRLGRHPTPVPMSRRATCRVLHRVPPARSPARAASSGGHPGGARLPIHQIARRSLSQPDARQRPQAALRLTDRADRAPLHLANLRMRPPRGHRDGRAERPPRARLAHVRAATAS
jgi:hypothetical protein